MYKQMNGNSSIPLQEALRRAQAISESAEYQQFLELIKEKYPWRFQHNSANFERDYFRVVDHHLENLIPRVRGCIGSGFRRVFDFGCGSGGSAIALAMVFPDICCVGTDVDTQEVAIACERAKLYGVEDRCHFYAVAENHRLPFPDSSFEFCLCSSVLEYVTDKHGRKFCVREMARLIAPGGLLFVSGPNRLYPFEVHSWWNGSPKWGWNYFPKLLRAHTVDCTVWEVQKLAKPVILKLHNTPLTQLLKPWSSFCLKKEV